MSGIGASALLGFFTLPIASSFGGQVMTSRQLGRALLLVALFGSTSSTHADTLSRHGFASSGKVQGAGSSLVCDLGGPWAGVASSEGLSIRVGYDLGGTGDDGIIPTSVSPPALAPSRLALPGNQPNPFNPSTMLHYEIPADAGHIVLRIVDLQGRLVRVLIDDELGPGRGSVRWRGDDRTGQLVSSGVYLAVLSSGRETVSRRITLLK